MVELRRSIRCSNCNTDTNFYLSSELALSELLVHGKCSRCGNSLQINFSIIAEGGAAQQPQQSQGASQSQAQSGGDAMVNLDESLFEPEIPSESIKELIEG